MAELEFSPGSTWFPTLMNCPSHRTATYQMTHLLLSWFFLFLPNVFSCSLNHWNHYKGCWLFVFWVLGFFFHFGHFIKWHYSLFQLLNSTLMKHRYYYCHTWMFSFKNTTPFLILTKIDLKEEVKFSTVFKILSTELKSILTKTKASIHGCMISAAKAEWWTETLSRKHIQYHNTKQNAIYLK